MELQELLSSPREYVAHWLSSHKCTITGRGILTDANDRNCNAVLGSLYLDYKEEVNAFRASQSNLKPALRQNIAVASIKDLEIALNEHIQVVVVENKNKVKAALQCENETLQPLEQFVTAVTGATSLADTVVMAHWLWQIKRKLNGLSVNNHLMPIVFGKQGAGKSVALNKLLAPLHDYRLNISIPALTDSRYHTQLESNFVCVFDEMAGAARADVEALKFQLTADYNDTRLLGTNNVIKCKQNCSFIGTSNRPLNELILDSTGMRRFYEIKAQDRLDWETLNTFDFIALWKGIDENKEHGYFTTALSEIQKAIADQQADLVHQDEVMAWAEELQIVCTGTGSKKAKNSDIYYSYTAWCERNGYKHPKTSVALGKRLTQLLGASIIITAGGKSTRYYNIHPDCEISGCEKRYYNNAVFQVFDGGVE